MAETASQTTTIAAAPDRVWAIAIDFEQYPEWAKDIKNVIVRERDAEGRATEVEYRASALGRSTHYTLGYDYSHEVKRAMDGCLACKACVGQCPIKVDVPAFRARFPQ